MKTILVVDDEPKIVQLARDYLEHAGFAVLTAFDGPAALHAARSSKPDLIVLDLGLPQIDGLDVTRSIRKDSEVPIIMLTARSEESDKLIGLELGADDYLTKPFSPKELVARVRTVLRRTDRSASAEESIRAADLTLDVPRALTVGVSPSKRPPSFNCRRWRANRTHLHAGAARCRGGITFESYERAIDAHKNIRRRIRPNPREPRYILTVYGMGYKFTDECRRLLSRGTAKQSPCPPHSSTHSPPPPLRCMTAGKARAATVQVLGAGQNGHSTTLIVPPTDHPGGPRMSRGRPLARHSGERGASVSAPDTSSGAWAAGWLSS
jgi:DNA-binding response OmpR family regulator